MYRRTRLHVKRSVRYVNDSLRDIRVYDIFYVKNITNTFESIRA